MQVPTALLAEHLLKHQPESVGSRLMRGGFGARFGLQTRTIVTAHGVGRFDRTDLLAAARHVHSDSREAVVQDLDGNSAVINRDQTGLVLRPVNSETSPVEVRLDDFLIVSSNREERLVCLESLMNRIGPAAPDFSDLQRSARERALDDEEAGMVLDEAWDGVAALQAKAATALEAGSATTQDLVPGSMAYYERFCGPDPSGAEPEAYLTTTLPAYRRDLLSRHPVGGLDICLLGALRDDLSPEMWVRDTSDESLWHALEGCKPDRDPYSLLGALDIALSRQHDSRYRSFAEDAVEKLTGAEFPRPDGSDTYELLPIFARVVFNRLTMVEDGVVRPPYWRRMSAWMQAGLLSRLTLTLTFDMDRLHEWIGANETATNAYARMLDLRREPMFHAGEMSATALRSEIVGRLLVLRSRHEAMGRTVPRAADIDAAMERLNEVGLPLGWALPGPLEGHKHQVRELPTDEVERLIEALGAEPDKSVWARLAYLSQLFALGPDLMEAVRQAARVTVPEVKAAAHEEYIERLEHACHIAVARRDVELARAIGKTILIHAPRIGTGQEAAAALAIAVLAGAAFRPEEEWAAWLEEQLAETAARLPSGQPIESFSAHLAALKQLLPLHLVIQARAEALCAAAL